VAHDSEPGDESDGVHGMPRTPPSWHGGDTSHVSDRARRPAVGFAA
jgi:hypothetical protein